MAGEGFVIDHVYKEFPLGRKQKMLALNDISLTVAKNEFVALLGTSGCGKSTLLRMLCGLDFPTSGTILREGKPVEGTDISCGMVFQAYTLFPWLSTIENVAYGLRQRGKNKEEAIKEAETFLSDVGLSEFRDAYPKELSGGMRQRVAIARALANNPDVLLLDEPFGALDAQTRINMQELMLEMWRKYPKTVVMVTHDVEEAIYMADRVVIFNARPGSVKEIMDIDIPRPRDLACRKTEKFIAYKHYATKLIQEENLKAAMEIRSLN